MNIAIGTSNSTWRNLKARYIVGIVGIALAIGIAIGGVNALPRSNHEARVAPLASSQPSTLFATAADAAFAAQGYVAVSPTFGTTSDAVDALPSLASLEASIAPAYATMSDAVDALPSIAPAAVAVAPTFGTMSDAVDALSNLAAQEAMLAPAFATMSDAVDALPNLARVVVSSSAVAPLYANSADAVDASLAAIGYAPVTNVAKSESPLFGTMADADYASR